MIGKYCILSEIYQYLQYLQYDFFQHLREHDAEKDAWGDSGLLEPVIRVKYNISEGGCNFKQ